MAKNKGKKVENVELVENVEQPAEVKPKKNVKVKKDVKARKEVKVKKHKEKLPLKTEEAKGLASVELMLVFPDEPASCSFDSSTGHLILRVPQALDGQPGADGLPGPAGAPGPEGPQGPAGPGLDLSRAPGGADAFFLFVDETGRLAYSANGVVSYVNLTPADVAWQ